VPVARSIARCSSQLSGSGSSSCSSISLIRLLGEESLNYVRRRSRQLQDLFGPERFSAAGCNPLPCSVPAWQASVLFYSNNSPERR
jgi:hypothetical protein